MIGAYIFYVKHNWYIDKPLSGSTVMKADQVDIWINDFKLKCVIL